MSGDEQGVPRTTWKQLLAELPPGRVYAMDPDKEAHFDRGYFLMPEMRMHCGECRGPMLFKCTERPSADISGQEHWNEKWATYECKQCERVSKRYALLMALRAQPSEIAWHVVKVGEFPPFGPPVPAGLVSLVGGERELFLKGRNCESLGLGIGAFAYYRRVVDSQRVRLLDEVIKVAEQVKAPPEQIEALKRARQETRFTDSLKLAGGALPRELLLIAEQNPLLLLQHALSAGIHRRSDRECLARAQAAREVLTRLAERLAELTKDPASLAAAIKQLQALREEDAAEGEGNDV